MDSWGYHEVKTTRPYRIHNKILSKTSLFCTLQQWLIKVTGIFFESKIDYTTWFGDNVEYIHGIQVDYVAPALFSFSSRGGIFTIWAYLSTLCSSVVTFKLATSYCLVDQRACVRVCVCVVCVCVRARARASFKTSIE